MYLFIFPMHQAADEDYTSCLLFNFFPNSYFNPIWNPQYKQPQLFVCH